MKNIKYIVSFLLITAVVMSCRDDDSDPLEFDDLENGAYMRQIELVSGSFDLFDIGNAAFVVTLEAEDANQGALFSSYDVYVSFKDNTTANGGSDIDEVFIKNVSASAFSKDAESGLPRATITVTAAEAMSVLGITSVDLDGGDTFDFRGEMNLTDGRSFTNTTSGQNVTGGPFYNSPFFNRVAVVCEFNPVFYTGDYSLVQTAGPTDPFFGGNRFTGDAVVTINVGETSTQRIFELTYVTFTDVPFVVNLVCGNVVVPFQGSGIGCGGPGLNWISDPTDQTTFSITDDSVLLIRFIENVDGGCGLPADPGLELKLTKL